ncbi:MAG TPA: polysaccharide deacetylase family protein [Bacteroidia bacterium]|nr:polysaccharide deacetylase family protein [Bacteroidia bacterium]
MFYQPVRPPYLLRWYYPAFIWKVPAADKSVYLTFDDGPIPEVTPFVLDTLKEYNAKATFFCIGKNVEQNGDIYKRILKEGHRTGNHTYNHPNGWNTTAGKYIANVQQAQQYIGTDLFRPPYGLIRKAQSKILMRNFKIIMWDVLSYDFETENTPEQCFRNVTRKIRPGSIVVFHDSIKAQPNMEYALPKTLHYLKEEGYACKAIQF